jgi:hypothetical protein
MERVVDDLNKWLPYVASDAERFGNTTELIRRSHEFHLAAQAIYETLPHPSLASGAKGRLLRVRIGNTAVDAFSFHRLPYDFLATEHDTAQPGEVRKLLVRHTIGTDIFDPSKTQPVFGQLKYFDLATLGRTIKDGGELGLTEPDSSSNE